MAKPTSSALLLAILAGCASSESPSGPMDAGSDSASKDSGADVLSDIPSGPDTRLPPVICNNPLPSDFVCEPTRDAPGKSVCTDAAIDAMLACFGTTGSDAACAKAQADFPACAQCAMKDWLVDNRLSAAACVSKIDPGAACARAVQCNTDCLAFVCSDKKCDSTPGSGSVASRSELQDCYVSAQFAGSSVKGKGACYDLASKDYAACAADSKYAVCFLRTIDDARFFLRGACRDGGDFSNVSVAK